MKLLRPVKTTGCQIGCISKPALKMMARHSRGTLPANMWPHIPSAPCHQPQSRGEHSPLPTYAHLCTAGFFQNPGKTTTKSCKMLVLSSLKIRSASSSTRRRTKRGQAFVAVGCLPALPSNSPAHRGRRILRRAAPFQIRLGPHLEDKCAAIGNVRMAEPRLVPRLAI